MTTTSGTIDGRLTGISPENLMTFSAGMAGSSSADTLSTLLARRFSTRASKYSFFQCAYTAAHVALYCSFFHSKLQSGFLLGESFDAAEPDYISTNVRECVKCGRQAPELLVRVQTVLGRKLVDQDVQ